MDATSISIGQGRLPGRLADWRSILLHREPPSRVLGMVVLCFAGAGVELISVAFSDSFGVDPARELRGAGIAAFGGVLYLALIRRFRTWMLHTVVVIGFVTGTLALERAPNPEQAALVVSTLLWTCVYVGVTFSLRTTRIYAAFVSACLAVGFGLNQVSGGAGLWLIYAASFAVTMEILGRMSNRLRSDAVTDPLTGALNRKGLGEAADRAIASSRRAGQPLTVAHLDLDGFKQINDRGGHSHGDRVLRDCVEAWKAEIRGSDVLARVGGDEFVVVLPASGLDSASEVLERMRSRSPAGFSFGIHQIGPDEELDSALALADVELYAAKGRRAMAAGR